MALLSQSFSCSSIEPSLSSSQYIENTTLNPIDGLRRVTIRQLLTATETAEANVFKIDEFPIKKFMLVANVLANNTADVSSGKVTYRLDDGTGRIMGHRWPLPAGDPPFVNFSYARIVAELEAYKSSRSLKVYHVRPVHDGYEIYHHLLHAMIDTLSLEREPPVYPPLITEINLIDDERLTQGVQELDIQRTKGKAPLQRQDTELVDDYPEASSSRLPDPATDPEQSTDGRNSLEQDIIEALIDKEPKGQSIDGVHVEDFIPDIITSHPGITPTELSQTLEEMISRGIIATGLSDEYFRCL